MKIKYIYVYEEYPKMLYIDNQEIIVYNKEEEQEKLGEKNESDNKDNSERSDPQINDNIRSVGNRRQSKRPRSK
jgi:hypothetical protein